MRSASLVFLALLCASAARPDPAALPDGVHYARADAKTLDESAAKLKAALAGGPAAIARLFGTDTHDAKTMVGPYFAIEMDADGLDGRNFLIRNKYTFPLPEHPPGYVIRSFVAVTPAHKRLLASYVALATRFGDEVDIRAPTFDELALIWAWIGWDLDDPLLVADSGEERFVFDFDPKTGLVTWVERLTRPCFTAMVDEQLLGSCFCSRIVREGMQWQLAFEKAERCDAPSRAQVDLAARRAGAAGRPSVYLRTSDRTARIDALLAHHLGGSYAVQVIDSNLDGYASPGKLLAGSRPMPVLEDGKPLEGYVLLGSVVSAAGTMDDSRVLLSSDDRLSAAVLAASKTWRVEPPRRDGKPVAEIVWQQHTF